MNLLNRYLQAVKFWLPAAQKDDIIAELSEELRSQIEEKETALGRPLADTELEALLRQVGRPVLVANRYLPQRHLVGPVLFPIYLFVLKIVAVGYLAPSILVWIGLLVYDPKYRDSLGLAWSQFWLAAFTAIGVTTLVFAVLEQVQARSGFLERWDPAKLPAVRDTRRIPRAASTLELVVNALFCGWWLVAMRSPLLLNQPAVQMTFAPVWPLFFWSFLAVAAANITLAAVNLARPYWTTSQSIVRLVNNLTSSALMVGLVRSRILAGLVVPGVSSATTQQIADTINRIAFEAWPAVLVAGFAVLAVDLYRVVRSRGREGQVTGGPRRAGLNSAAR